MLHSRHTLLIFRKAVIFILTLSLITPPNAFAYFPQELERSSVGAETLGIFAWIKQRIQGKPGEVPGLLLPLEHPLPEKEPIKEVETKDQLKARIGKFKSYLKETLEMEAGEHFLLPIIPLSWDDHPVQGIIPEFETTDDKVVMVTYRGEIWAGKPGKAKITVIGGASRMTFDVTVSKRKPNEDKKEDRIGFVNKSPLKKAVWTSSTSRNGLKPKKIVKRAATFVQSGPPPPAPSYQNVQPFNVGTPPIRTETPAPTSGAATRGSERPGANGFSFNVPLLALPGRGLNLALGLFYDSVVWKKDGATTPAYYFDNESGVSPGFRIGYGRLRLYENKSPSYNDLQAATLTDGNGTKHNFFTEVNAERTPSGGLISNSDDGTFIRHLAPALSYASPFSLSDLGVTISPDGTRIQYGMGRQISFSQPNAQTYFREVEGLPVKITDRNGNYIEIAYDPNNFGKIAYIRDTLGRMITFYYEAGTFGGTRLVCIEAPGFNTSTPRQIARFYYNTLDIAASFSNKSAATVTPGLRDVLTAVYYPGTQNGYSYNYSTYGMIYQIRELRGMTVSTTNKTLSGSVTSDGQVAATTIYNYPQFASGLTDVPKYTTRTDSWTGMNYHESNTNPGTPLTAPLVTFFLVDAATNTSTITAPDGSVTISKTATNFNSSGFDNEFTQRKGNKQIKTTAHYEIGGPYTGNNPRVKWVKVEYQNYDSTTMIGTTAQSKQTDYVYDTATYTVATAPRSVNNVIEVIEKDFSGNVIRNTKTSYETRKGWLNRWIIRLPRTVQVFDPRVGGGATPVSKIKYTYDSADETADTSTMLGGNLNASNLVQRYNASSCPTGQCAQGCNGCDDAINHDPAFNPSACPVYVDMSTIDPNDPDCFAGYCDPPQVPPFGTCDGTCNFLPTCVTPYNSSNSVNNLNNTNYRGNVTKVESYGDAANNLVAVTTTYTYDIAGNVITESNGCCQAKTYAYNKAYEYAWPISVTRGTLTSSASFDKNTGLKLTDTDENGRVTSYTYYTDSLRPYQVIRPDGGKTQWIYWSLFYDTPDAAHKSNLVLVRTDASSTGISDRYQITDGLGRTTRTVGHHYFNGFQQVWSVSDIEYDNLSRVKRASNPFYSTFGQNAPTNPTGKWVTTEYEELGRRSKTVLQDGESSTNSNVVRYAYSLSGDVVTVSDQEGTERRFLSDSLGRLVETHETDANNSIGPLLNANQRTAYVYDALDNIVKITQGITQSNPDGGQTRCFKYDSLGRLIYEKQPEKATPHTTATADILTGMASWSSKITYNSQGLLEDSWDARNIKTHFNYDSLKRVKDVTFTDSANLTYSPKVTYNYDQAVSGYFNAGRLTEILTDAMGGTPATKHKYNYNLIGNVTNHVQTIGTQNYTIAYQYDLLGRMTGETYPSGRLVTYDYHPGSGLRGVSDSLNNTSRTYLFNVNYTAHGALWQESLGNSTVRVISYNDRLQPVGVNLTQGSLQLLNLAYQYGQVDQATGVLHSNKNTGRIAVEEGFIAGTRRWQNRYSYDAVGRLVKAGEYRGDNLAMVWRMHYGYDQYGNRYQSQTAQPDNANVAFTPIVENVDIVKGTNRFASMTNMSYDAAGNITSDGKFLMRSFTYDANNRQLTSVPNLGGTSVTSTYDGLGQRVKAVDNTIRYCVYDILGRPVTDYESSQTTLAREYIYRETGSLIASIESSNSVIRYFSTDLQGTPRVQLDSSGAVLSRNDYYPFGEGIASSMGMRSGVSGYGQPTPIRKQFVNLEREVEGTDHTIWRKYEGKAGRWSSVDPFSGSFIGTNPQTFNRYIYCNNDPLNYVDSDGQIPLPLVTAGIGAAIGFTSSIAGQVISNGGVRGLEFKTVIRTAAIAGATGAAAGLLAPFAASAWAVAAIGGLSNASQYYFTQKYGGNTPSAITPNGLLWNFGWGALGGGVLGGFTKAGNFADPILPFVARNPEVVRTFQSLNHSATMAAQVGALTLFDNLVTNTFTNSLPPEAPVPSSSNLGGSAVGFTGTSFGPTGSVFSGGPSLRQFEVLERLAFPRGSAPPTIQITIDCIYGGNPVRILKCIERR